MKKFIDLMNESNLELKSYNVAFFKKPGIYKVNKNFKKVYGTSHLRGAMGDLFKISPHRHIQSGFSDGFEGNDFYLWNKQSKSWDQKDHQLGSKSPKDAQDFMKDIEGNFTFVASKESSPKVKKLLLSGETKHSFKTPQEAINFIDTLDPKQKINIELV